MRARWKRTRARRTGPSSQRNTCAPVRSSSVRSQSFARTRCHSAPGDRVARLAGMLADRGISHGDRIALTSENRAEVLEVLLAAAWLGAIVACQNWRLTATERARCIDLVAPRLTIGSAKYSDA